jgi:hypothetical protein
VRNGAYSEAQIAEVVRVYDGRSESIDAVVKRLAPPARTRRKAKCAANLPARCRIAWNAQRDAWLRAKWGRVPIERISEALGATAVACKLRAARLGISTRNLEDFSIKELESLTKVNHRQWHFCRSQGWLTGAWEQPRTGAPPVVRVSVEALHDLLRRKPEVFDYRRANKAAARALRLNDLPDPPRFKRLTCRSDAYADGIKPAAVGQKWSHGSVLVERRTYKYSLLSCDALGGTRFWASTYASDASCPRCGCRVSRYSEGEGEYSDVDCEDDSLAAVAGKLGLIWRDGALFDENGVRLQDEELLRHVFDGRRRPTRAFGVFRRLLKAGLNVGRAIPVPTDRWLPDITGMVLRDDQPRALEEFRANGRVGLYIPPGQGKSALGRYILTRLAGTHVVFVPTRILRDQWIRSFRQLRKNVVVRSVYRPARHTEIVVHDQRGRVRSTIEIYNYRTRFDFANKRYVCRVFDEAQFVPGNKAIALLYQAQATWQLSLTATPFREDGRSDVIDVVSASTVGADWADYRARGAIPDIPVSVLVVPDLEAKFERLKRLVDRSERTLIFSDSVRTGERISRELSVPYVCSKTKRKLATVLKHRTVALSRSGDCGVSLDDVAHVVEMTFHGGSRAQSLQRHGRLLHSKAARLHTVLMTYAELARFARRLSILESRGCRIQLKLSTGRAGRPSPVTPLKLEQGRRPAAWCDVVLPLAA